MTHARTALVVGGGIAGPAAAMALQKAGIGSVVYEAHAASAEGSGAFLTLATNGVGALRTLGAAEPAVAAGFPTTANTLWSGTGKRLGAAAVSMTLADGTTGYTLKRARLYRAVHDQAVSRGIRIEHGKRLVAAETTSGGVRARFADGSEATGDLLIGCDGVHSTVRRIIDPHAPAPAARGSLAAISTSQWRQRLVGLFADDAGPATRLIEATSHDLAASPVHTMPRLPTWHSGRMIVIGDAAHAPSPTSGQGASLAIEDAVLLGKCLRDLPGPDQAFATFEWLRRPRAERVIKQGARINNNKAATGAARVFRDMMMPVMLPLFVRFIANGKPGKQLYGYHIDWDTPVTADPGTTSLE